MDDVSPEKPHPKPIDENEEVVMVLKSEDAIHPEEEGAKLRNDIEAPVGLLLGG